MFAELCQNVIRTWNGAIADNSANRLIIWGGGHNNYYGNEIYALNLTANPITLVRLKDPTVPTNYSNSENCIDGIPPAHPNAPNSREDYGGLAFIPGPYQMFIEGGSMACLLGNETQNTWTIPLNNLSNSSQWVHMNPTLTGPLPGSVGGFTYGNIADYDPNTGLVFLSDSASIYTYNFQTNTYTRISAPDFFVTSIYLSGAIDPVRKLFVLVGGCSSTTSCGPGDGVFVADISNPTTTTEQNWTAATMADPNCAEYLSGGANSISASNPGITYDSVANDFVGWPNEGNSVYILTPDTVNKRLTCQKLTFANGPPNSSHANNQPNTSYGTFGRFRYFPALDVFVLVNDANIPPYILRLRNSTSPDFTITATPTSETLNPGGTAMYTVNVAAVNGFSGTVDLTVTSGLPSGAEATFSPSSVNGSGSSTLTVTTTASTPTGSPTLTIAGMSGALAHSTAVTLNVEPSDFSITASPSTASVTPGGTATYTATVTAIGTFNSAVTFSASGLPTGANATFSPASVNASGSSTMTVTTSASTPTGTFTLSVTGTGGGLVHSANVMLTVTNTVTATVNFVQGNYSDPQASVSSVSVTFTSSQAAGDLIVVAVAWFDTTTKVSSISDSARNTYTLAIGPTLIGGGEPIGASIYYAKNIAAAAAGTNVVTVNFNDAAFFPDVRILEYSGASTTSPIDVMAASTGTNSLTSSGPLITTNANDLILAANAVWTSSIGPGSGFTTRILTQPDHDIVEDEMVTATGTYTATSPLNGSGPWVMQAITVKAR